jgi:enterobactin synthetase component F
VKATGRLVSSLLTARETLVKTINRMSRKRTLFGYALFRAALDRFFWYARNHHFCNDGFGGWLVAQRVAELYTALTENRTPQKRSEGSLLDLINDEQGHRLSTRYLRDANYWREQVVQCPAPVTLSGKQPARSRAIIRSTEYLAAPVADALRALSDAHDTSLPQVIMAGVALYLYHLTALRDFTLGVPVTGRVGSRMRSIVGMVSNVLPLRLANNPVEETQRLLQEVPEAYRTEINDLLLAALTQALCESLGTDSIKIELEGHGREELFEGIDVSRTVGWFTRKSTELTRRKQRGP